MAEGNHATFVELKRAIVTLHRIEFPANAAASIDRQGTLAATGRTIANRNGLGSAGGLRYGGGRQGAPISHLDFLAVPFVASGLTKV